MSDLFSWSWLESIFNWHFECLFEFKSSRVLKNATCSNVLTRTCTHTFLRCAWLFDQFQNNDGSSPFDFIFQYDFKVSLNTHGEERDLVDWVKLWKLYAWKGKKAINPKSCLTFVANLIIWIAKLTIPFSYKVHCDQDLTKRNQL